MPSRQARVLSALWLFCFLGPASAWAQATATDDAIRFYQARVSRDPDDTFNYNKLGAAYIQKARDTGDLTYYDLAEKAVRRSLTLLSDHPDAAPATTALAQILFAKHEFAEALKTAGKAVALGGGDPSPYAVMGDAYVEMGEYAKAETAYGRLLGLPGARHPHGRLAVLHFLRGQPRVAIQGHQRAAKAATRANVSPEIVGWHYLQLGDGYFDVGDLNNAEKSYGDALAAYPGYHRASASLAKVRSVKKRYDEAIALYQKALAVVPLPEYAGALGDVFTKLGRAVDAKKQYDLVDYIGALSALNKTVYNRELALFYADHDLKLPAALELAKKELEVRRDVYSYDVLAWALYKNGHLREALAAMQKALRLGTKDARLYFHAGMIHHGLGDVAKAEKFLRSSLTTNPHFHLLQAEVAQRTLEELRASSRRSS